LGGSAAEEDAVAEESRNDQQHRNECKGCECTQHGPPRSIRAVAEEGTYVKNEAGGGGNKNEDYRDVVDEQGASPASGGSTTPIEPQSGYGEGDEDEKRDDHSRILGISKGSLERGAIQRRRTALLSAS
jgi:hypothetical protein